MIYWAPREIEVRCRSSGRNRRHGLNIKNQSNLFLDRTPSRRRIAFGQQAVDLGDRSRKSGVTLGQSGLGYLASADEIYHADEALDQPCPRDDAGAVDRQCPSERLDGAAP